MLLETAPLRQTLLVLYALQLKCCQLLFSKESGPCFRVEGSRVMAGIGGRQSSTSTLRAGLELIANQNRSTNLAELTDEQLQERLKAAC